ncbi:MAG: class I SAM-dependent methyltransferase [Eubacteriaceae bacterium]|nr:class I SAM-dependent methyltransferase [Eubacteriaceae bacterium]
MPKKEKIQQMFDGIAGDYDRLNHLMSLGIDRTWRRRALKEIVRRDAAQEILDIACGTGDFSLAIAGRMHPDSRITGLDLSEGMLAVMRALYFKVCCLLIRSKIQGMVRMAFPGTFTCTEPFCPVLFAYTHHIFYTFFEIRSFFYDRTPCRPYCRRHPRSNPRKDIFKGLHVLLMEKDIQLAVHIVRISRPLRIYIEHHPSIIPVAGCNPLH